MISELIDDYPDRFALVEMHVNGDGIDTDWAQQRLDVFYAQAGFVPTFVVDGWVFCPAEDYRYWVEELLTVPTDVTIELAATQQAGPDWRVAATVCVDAGGVGKTMEVYTAALLDGYPNPPRYSRNTLMQDVVEHQVTVAAGDCEELTIPISFDPLSWSEPDRLKVVVWAQDRPTGAVANVHQAAQMSWPFPSAPQLTQIRISPPTATVAVGGTLQLSASGIDQSGNGIVLSDPQWSLHGSQCGTVSPLVGATEVSFTATAVGSCELECRDGAVSGRASLEVVAQALARPRRILGVRRP